MSSDLSNPANNPFDDSVKANLIAIKAEIEKAASVAGRTLQRDPVHLVAVSKKQEPHKIISALAAGHKVFGENRVQEAMGKWPALKEQFADIEVRLIGPLQSNKTKEAVSFFDVIETVDRPKIARALADELQRQGRSVTMFVQINTGQEDQKAGIIPVEADDFITRCRREFELPVQGVMCIPPADQAPAPHFALLEKIAKRNGLDQVSMGMSADYPIAVKLGATHIRVGTGIFGPRS